MSSINPIITPAQDFSSFLDNLVSEAGLTEPIKNIDQFKTVITILIEKIKSNNDVLPDGFTFTALQKGDISASLHLLIQKPIKAKKYLGVVSFSTSVRHFDFILFNLLTGAITAKINDMRLRAETENENMSNLSNS